MISTRGFGRGLVAAAVAAFGFARKLLRIGGPSVDPRFYTRLYPGTLREALLPKRAFLYASPSVAREAAFSSPLVREVTASGYWSRVSKSHHYRFSVDGPIIVVKKDLT